MKRLKSLLAATVIAVVSCQNVEPVLSFDNEIQFDINLIPTKASATAFETGDNVSMWAVEYNAGEQIPLQIGGNYINNEKLSYDGVSWAGSRTLFWSANACDFYALYPYQTVSSISNQPFSVAIDQNSVRTENSLGGYEASDLMFAKAENVVRTDGPVQMSFHHMLARCKVNIVKGAEFEGEIPNDITVHIYNTVTDAIVNIAKGTLEKNPLGNRKTITMRKLDNEHFDAIVIPQNIENRTPLIEVTMGGIAYLLEYSLSFKPAYTHTINLTLNTSPDQEQIEISIDPGIDDWD